MTKYSHRESKEDRRVLFLLAFVWLIFGKIIGTFLCFLSIGCYWVIFGNCVHLAHNICKWKFKIFYKKMQNLAEKVPKAQKLLQNSQMKKKNERIKNLYFFSTLWRIKKIFIAPKILKRVKLFLHAFRQYFRNVRLFIASREEEEATSQVKRII